MPLLRLLGPYVVWLYPIGVVILLFHLRAWLVASRDLRSSLFTLEREMAVARTRRAAVRSCVVFVLLVGLFVVQFFVGPTIQLADWIKPTPTPEFIPRVSYVTTATPTLPPTSQPTPQEPTATRRPTQRPVTATPSISPSPTAGSAGNPPANCPNPGIRITQPGDRASVQGRVEIRGTARIPNFQFYKIEVGVGENPLRWNTISEVHRTPVGDGLLEVWDASGLAPGVYSLRLVVVDVTGNFDPPCQIRLTVTR